MPDVLFRGLLTRLAGRGQRQSLGRLTGPGAGILPGRLNGPRLGTFLTPRLRRFLAPLLAPLLGLCLSLVAAPDAAAQSLRLLIYSAPLAGSQYYALATLGPQIRVGDPLALVREPDNRHDPAAIRVEWRGHKLGYLPRAANRLIAAAMDRGDRLVARVAGNQEHPDPWQRLRIEVHAEL